MNSDVFVEQLLEICGFNVEHEYYQPARERRLVKSPNLHPQVMKYVLQEYNGEVFIHQAKAIDATLKGENVVQTTSTASGKTLGFALPVFDAIIKNPDCRALFFYPTKSLSGDQLKGLQEITQKMGLRECVFRFDGDTSQAERKKALKNGRILLCTPEVLHATMLKHNNEAE